VGKVANAASHRGNGLTGVSGNGLLGGLLNGTGALGGLSVNSNVNANSSTGN
jgi:hypothetical protein